MMTPSDARRVVVTGLGHVGPMGATADELWARLTGGQSGVAPLQRPIGPDFPVPFGGEAWGFRGEIDDFGLTEPGLKKTIKKALKLMCRESQMAVAAAQRAFAHAALAPGVYEPERVGVVFGSDYMLTDPEEMREGIEHCMVEGEVLFDRWGDGGMQKMQPLWLLKYLPNMPACHIAIFNDLRGPSNSLTHREASGNLAIGEAWRTIRRGHAECMVAGATGTRLHLMHIIHAVQQESVAQANGAAPQAVSRPFDIQRHGMVLGEGSGVLILEELQSAEKRGATILAEVIGAGSSMASTRKFQARRQQAVANALRAALRQAQIEPSAVGHYNAHGLSTRDADVEESQALREVFGDVKQQPPLVAPKSFFGNLGGGGSVVELIGSVLALRHGSLFPVLNYETPDPECPVNAVRENGAPAGAIAAKISFTPQGQASCVVLKRWEV